MLMWLILGRACSGCYHLIKSHVCSFHIHFTSITHTHTHLHMWFMVTLHRSNGFYTVELIIFSIPNPKLTPIQKPCGVFGIKNIPCSRGVNLANSIQIQTVTIRLLNDSRCIMTSKSLIEKHTIKTLSFSLFIYQLLSNLITCQITTSLLSS